MQMTPITTLQEDSWEKIFRENLGSGESLMIVSSEAAWRNVSIPPPNAIKTGDQNEQADYSTVIFFQT